VPTFSASDFDIECWPRHALVVHSFDLFTLDANSLQVTFIFMRLKTINSVTSFLETTSFSQSIVLDDDKDDDDDEKTIGATFGRWCLHVVLKKRKLVALALRVLATVVALAAAVLVVTAPPLL
jgi:hypothetical protein